MTFEIVEGVAKLSLNLIFTTTLAGILLMFGYFIRKKVAFFEKFCFPVSVIGGFAFALLTLVLKTTGVLEVSLDTTLQAPFMLAFFTSVGLGGSLALIKKGGKAMMIYLATCWALSFIQNGFGSSLAKLFGIHPALGVMAGAVSLEGGHGAAATFGPMAEELGVHGATAVAIASATFGLIAGSLLGGPLARFLIEKNKVKIESSQMEGELTYEEMVAQRQQTETITSQEFLYTMTLIGVLMSLGSLVVASINNLQIKNFALPAYVGAMLVAIIVRNINDKIEIVKLNTRIIDLIADISIGMFLTMAMMSLKIWELASLALPLIGILVLQTTLLLLICIFFLFPVLGKDYDAAVICAGMMGHGLGATPNAVANMGSVGEHYGVRSNKAFLIVPLCGAVLVDLVGIPCIVLFINLLTG